jgi:Putative peptidoglycan binding domain/Papain-like cysteine protease AvrRpt2
MATMLMVGSYGVDVAELQLRLNLKSTPSPVLVVDGAFGGKTQAAVMAFQLSAGLKRDGIVGNHTHAALALGLAITRIHHAVKHIAQPTDTTCWAASTAMMSNSSVPAVQAKTPAAMVGPTGGLRNSSGSDQAVVTGAAYGALHGLRCFPPQSWSVSGFLGALKPSPLMIDMLWNAKDYAAGNASPGHMVVISAAVSDNNANGERTHLLVLDPWKPRQGRIYWVSYAAWVAEVPTRTYRTFARM